MFVKLTKRSLLPSRGTLAATFFILFWARIVWSLTRDGNIMRMAFEHAGIGNTGELSIVQTNDIPCTDISHTRAQATDELVQHFLDRSLVWYTSGNAFRHKFLGVLDIVLEVAVTRTILLFHCLQRSHATICLELTSVEDDCLAGALFLPRANQS